MSNARPDERMSDIDSLVWAVEHEPRNRTTIAALARFDGHVDPGQLRPRIERVSRLIHRLHQRVVHDPSGIGAPRWSVHPEFRLAHHLRWMQLSDGSDPGLGRVVRDLIVQPFDRARPLWEFTVITGLNDGGSALLLKAHHAVSDGVGGVEMMLELFDLDEVSDGARADLPPAPTAASEPDTVVGSLQDELGRVLHATRARLGAVATPRSPDDLTRQARRLGETLGSAYCMFRPKPAAAGVSSERSDGLDLRFFSLDLDDLRDAGHRVGGTVNTAFVAAVALGVSDHHADSPSTGPLRVSIPISTRSADDGVGNHWTPTRVDLDVGADSEPDDVAREVLRHSAGLRDDPARSLVPVLTAGLLPLPDATTAALFSAAASAHDVAASNVPRSPVLLYLCGEPVRELIPFGPLSGAAVNVTLMSYGRTAHIGISSDPAAIADPGGLAHCLQQSFTALVKGS
ncbi:MAG: wax ester/triacylglycerol synthase family O-acyltransferase [Acidimicrobiales bacterium]|nr:wax ester/triacylglycerol synthase family O-acyltransferase [Acidimicrobiales bacterium]